MTWLLVTAAVLTCTVGVPVLVCLVDWAVWREVERGE